MWELDIGKHVITQILVGQMYFEIGYTIINMKYLLTTVARNGDDSFILVAFTIPYFWRLEGLIEVYFSSIPRNIYCAQ